jgi:hypothetical protein
VTAGRFSGARNAERVSESRYQRAVVARAPPPGDLGVEGLDVALAAEH